MINNPVAPVLNNAAGLGTLIGNLIAVGMIIASIMVLLYLILGGIEWMSSGGDKAGLESARNRITNALIGLAIVVSAWAIMTIVSSFLGLSFPCLPIPTLDGVKSTCATPTTTPGPTATPGPSGNVGAVCTVDATCNSKVCSFGKCAYDCSRDLTHTFGDSECWTHANCKWNGTACVYKK